MRHASHAMHAVVAVCAIVGHHPVTAHFVRTTVEVSIFTFWGQIVEVVKVSLERVHPHW